MTPLPQVPPAPADTALLPPQAAGGGFPSPAPMPQDPHPKKGELAIGVIASIQKVYLKEEQRLQQLQGMDKPLKLEAGWGGQGK